MDFGSKTSNIHYEPPAGDHIRVVGEGFGEVCTRYFTVEDDECIHDKAVKLKSILTAFHVYVSDEFGEKEVLCATHVHEEPPKKKPRIDEPPKMPHIRWESEASTTYVTVEDDESIGDKAFKLKCLFETDKVFVCDGNGERELLCVFSTNNGEELAPFEEMLGKGPVDVTRMIVELLEDGRPSDDDLPFLSACVKHYKENPEYQSMKWNEIIAEVIDHEDSRLDVLMQVMLENGDVCLM